MNRRQKLTSGEKCELVSLLILFHFDPLFSKGWDGHNCPPKPLLLIMEESCQENEEIRQAEQISKSVWGQRQHVNVRKIVRKRYFA